MKKSSKISKRPLSRSPQAPGRSAVIKDAFQQNYPLVQYHFVQFLTEHLVDCLQTFGGDFEQVIILAVLGQSHLNALLAPEESKPKGSLSASRIADVTGLPRETVRRKLSLLGARGWLSQNAAHEWVLVGPSDRTVAGRGLTKLDSRALARLATLHAMLEPLTKPPKMGT